MYRIHPRRGTLALLKTPLFRPACTGGFTPKNPYGESNGNYCKNAVIYLSNCLQTQNNCKNTAIQARIDPFQNSLEKYLHFCRCFLFMAIFS